MTQGKDGIPRKTHRYQVNRRRNHEVWQSAHTYHRSGITVSGWKARLLFATHRKITCTHASKAAVTAMHRCSACKRVNCRPKRMTCLPDHQAFQSHY
jgi:hypothetical protein